MSLTVSSFSSSRGFTMVELLVCVAIFGLLATMVVANYPETQMRLKLAEINQNMSLAFREAQLRGSAIDSQNTAVGGYGIYVSSATRDRVLIFHDFIDSAVPAPNGIPIGNGLYETGGGGPDETNTIILIPTRFSLAKLCVLAGGSYSCDSSNTPPITSITTTFIRPNPMPQIYINDSKTTSYSAACFEFHSIAAPKPGHVRNLQIFNSGLIKSDIGPC